jgi:dipeptidase E
VLFVPYALADYDKYELLVRRPFAELDIEIESIHRVADPPTAVRIADGLFIGGGNTFRLLKNLYERNLIGPIRDRVRAGMPYMGSSAGTNVACPTIRTTNDMPIVEPPSLAALGLVPFQINPHYLDADPKSTHKGETRAQRLVEYLEENDLPVVALREGSWLVVNGTNCQLNGTTGMVLFQRDVEPMELGSEADLSYLF